jgi:hypothetical protein
VSDISLNWGVLDYALIALIIGWPGLPLGGLLGALAWRAHRIYGGVLGAAAGLALWIGWRSLSYFN